METKSTMSPGSLIGLCAIVLVGVALRKLSPGAE